VTSACNSVTGCYPSEKKQIACHHDIRNLKAADPAPHLGAQHGIATDAGVML